MTYTDRIVALIDMDCFYCQVEEKLDPNLVGKPIAVVQYNQWRGGGIIAVNYLAREKGVTRQMRGDEAKEKCPNIQLPRVPQVRGKADLTKYRDAGKQVAEVLKTFTNILERASIDEAYLDLTEAVNTELKNGLPIISFQDVCNTFVVGSEISDLVANVYQNQNNGFCDEDLKLLVGGVIVEKIRAAVYKETGYVCSAGIAHNKTLAKLVCGLHKPNKQTILPQSAVPELFSTLPIRKIKSLGGKFGHTLSETLNISYVGELLKFSEKELVQRFDEKTGRWLYNISRGIDKDPVQVKLISKSIGCCKRFPGRTSLCKSDEVEHWMKELSSEIADRLEEDLRENNRKGRLMTVSFSQETNQTETTSSRAVPLKSYEMERISQHALEVINRFCRRTDGSYHVTFLGLSISNFENIKNVKTITSYFGKASKAIENPAKLNAFTETKSQNGTCQIPEKSMECVYNQDSLQNVSSDEDCDNKSIYSDSTIELEENPDDFIFYTDDTGENLKKRISESDAICLYRSSETSSEKEISSLDCQYPESPILGSRTCENLYDVNDSPKEIERDFDTSKIFEGHHAKSDEEMEQDNKSSDTQCNTFEISEKCKECDEVIPIVDIVSHMDYHLALKLSQEMVPKTVVDNKKQTNTKKVLSKKRKVSDLGGKSLISFFKMQEVDSDENSELCTQCNKRIKMVDISMHSDYHAAKELHSELNNPSAKGTSGYAKNSMGSPSSASNNTQVEKRRKGAGNIATFFKQVEPSL